jgi:hypothetical protein
MSGGLLSGELMSGRLLSGGLLSCSRLKYITAQRQIKIGVNKYGNVCNTDPNSSGYSVTPEELVVPGSIVCEGRKEITANLTYALSSVRQTLSSDKPNQSGDCKSSAPV